MCVLVCVLVCMVMCVQGEACKDHVLLVRNLSSCAVALSYSCLDLHEHLGQVCVCVYVCVYV